MTTLELIIVRDTQNAYLDKCSSLENGSICVNANKQIESVAQAKGYIYGVFYTPFSPLDQAILTSSF